MSDERSDVENKTRSDMKNSIGQGQIQTHEAGPSSPILTLNVDGFEELFEWLSLADLRSLRQTCKRLKQVVDYFIKMNYPAVQIGFGSIELYEANVDQFRQLDPVKIKMIKQAEIFFNTLTQKEIDIFKGILPQLERLKIGTWQCEVNFYESILKWCVNLKSLSIYRISMEIMGEEKDWLHRQYPTIEHILMDDNDIGGPGMASEYVELKTFFEMNPNIRTFSTTFNLLRANQNLFLGSNIKIDQLNVDGDCFYENGMVAICGLLNQLYEQGFHRRLSMRAKYIDDQTELNLITSVRGLEKLYLVCITRETKPVLLPDLREICIFGGDFEDTDSLAQSLVIVERVYFKRAKADLFASILRFARTVKEIMIDHLEEGANFENGVIDLAALNKVRKELDGAGKVTIYVKEDVFLSTKFAIAKTKLSLVSLKQAAAVKWAPEFQ